MSLLNQRVILAIIFMLAVDILWITINKQTYGEMVYKVQHKTMNVKFIAAIIAYTAMVLGLVFFVIPLAKADQNKNKIYKAIKYGAFFGFVVYAIYNATNYAIFADYSLNTAIMDTIWGSTVYFLAILIGI